MICKPTARPHSGFKTDAVLNLYKRVCIVCMRVCMYACICVHPIRAPQHNLSLSLPPHVVKGYYVLCMKAPPPVTIMLTAWQVSCLPVLIPLMCPSCFNAVVAPRLFVPEQAQAGCVAEVSCGFGQCAHAADTLSSMRICFSQYGEKIQSVFHTHLSRLPRLDVSCIDACTHAWSMHGFLRRMPEWTSLSISNTVKM